MKYYIRRDASSVIEGPFDLGAIRGWVAAGRFSNQYEAIPENGNSTDDAKHARKWQTLEEVFAEPEPVRNDQAPDAFLGRVRKRSCYKTLRVFIDLSVIAAWGAGAYAIYNHFGRELPQSQTETLLLALVAVVMLTVGLAAIRQSAVLFVDIADILIEQNRRR